MDSTDKKHFSLIAIILPISLLLLPAIGLLVMSKSNKKCYATLKI